MKRINLCIAIMAVMFLFHGLAFADPAFTAKSEGNVDVLISRGFSTNYGNLQYASEDSLRWAIGLRGVGPAESLFFHDEDAGTTRMMIDGTTGNVGIGLTNTGTPLHLLHVNGSVSSDRLKYNEPRVHYYSLGDGDFRSSSGGTFQTSTGSGGTYIDAGGSGSLVAGLHLPDGAVMTEFRAWVLDSAAADLTITFQKRNHNGSDFIGIGNLNSSGTPGVRDYFTQSISQPIIDNQNSSYHVKVSSNNWPTGPLLKIKGVIVTYTIQEAD